MVESFRQEDNAQERMRLGGDQVEVFFDEDTTENIDSIILDTAKKHRVLESTPYGVLEYDELILKSGDVLSPADLSPEQTVNEFSESLEPVMELGHGALLRTVEYRQDLKFLEIVKNDTTIAERKLIRESLLKNEQKRIPDSLIQQRELFDEDETLELWVRLEAANNPDKALVGKIIMARLAYFMTSRDQVGITPIIHNAANTTLSTIPKQLIIHENWLYREIM